MSDTSQSRSSLPKAFAKTYEAVLDYIDRQKSTPREAQSNALQSWGCSKSSAEFLAPEVAGDESKYEALRLVSMIATYLYVFERPCDDGREGARRAFGDTESYTKTLNSFLDGYEFQWSKFERLDFVISDWHLPTPESAYTEEQRVPNIDLIAYKKRFRRSPEKVTLSSASIYGMHRPNTCYFALIAAKAIRQYIQFAGNSPESRQALATKSYSFPMSIVHGVRSENITITLQPGPLTKEMVTSCLVIPSRH